MCQNFTMNILKTLREEAGISQSQLAMRSGVSISTIKKLESGERSINKVSLEMVCKFAVIFQVPIEYFVEYDKISLKNVYKQYFRDVMENIDECYNIRNRPYYVEYDEKVDPYERDDYRVSKEMEDKG